MSNSVFPPLPDIDRETVNTYPLPILMQGLAYSGIQLPQVYTKQAMVQRYMDALAAQNRGWQPYREQFVRSSDPQWLPALTLQQKRKTGFD